MKKKLALLLLPALLLGLVACGGGAKEKPKQATTEATNSEAAETNPASKSKEYFDPNTGELVLKDMTVKVTEYKRLAPGELPYSDSETILMLADFTNTSKELQSTMMLHAYIHAKQDTGSTIETLNGSVIFSEDPNYGDRAAIMQQDIKPGATVPIVMPFTITQPGKPVIMEYKGTDFKVLGEVEVS